LGLTSFPDIPENVQEIVEELYINKNKITVLPDDFSKFKNLHYFECEFNKLTTLPISI